MKGLLALSHAIDVLNRWMSLIAVWCVLLAGLLSAGNAFFRYSINEIIALARHYEKLSILQDVLKAYGNNSNSFLEAQWYMFAAIAMFGAAYTLKVNEHVRVDLLYGAVSERTRTWIDLLQGFSEIIKCIAALTTDYVREHAYEKPLQ